MQLLHTLVFLVWVCRFFTVGFGYSALLQRGIAKSGEIMQSLDNARHFGLPTGSTVNNAPVATATVTIATSAATVVTTAAAPVTVAISEATVATAVNATVINISNLNETEIFILRTTADSKSGAEITTTRTTNEVEAETISTVRSMFGGFFQFSGSGPLGNLISGSRSKSASLSASTSLPGSRYGRYRTGYGSGSGYRYGPAYAGKNSTDGDLLSMFEIVTFPPTTEKPQPPGNFDVHLDSIIENLSKTLRKNGFDPINVGNILQCSNCTLEGLSLIRRSGPSNFVYANRTVTVDAHLTLPALYISCFPCVDVVLMVPLSGMLEVALWGLKIYGKVSQKASRGANPDLIAYRVEHEGELDISLNGRGILAPITEFGFKVIRQRQVSDMIREFVYDRVPKFIRRRLKSFSFPIGK